MEKKEKEKNMSIIIKIRMVKSFFGLFAIITNRWYWYTNRWYWFVNLWYWCIICIIHWYWCITRWYDLSNGNIDVSNSDITVSVRYIVISMDEINIDIYSVLVKDVTRYMGFWFHSLFTHQTTIAQRWSKCM